MIFDIAALAGAGIFFCGCLFMYLRVREESRSFHPPAAEKVEPFKCPICAYIYALEKKDDLSSCPRCGTINKKEDACFP